jgi:fatty acid desaturase
MEQSTAVWFLIVLALVTANLPFLIERPLLVLPCARAGEPARQSWQRWLESLVFFVVLVAAVALLSYAGWRLRGASVQKPFFERLLEVLVFFGLVGMLGFGFELNIGNPFVQGWQFYAVALSLFLVLSYPGFVYRYLMRHHTSSTKDPAEKAARRQAANRPPRAASHRG